MKKLYLVITLIVLFSLCCCSCAKSSDIPIKSADAQSIEKCIENGEIDLENILDDGKHLVVVFPNYIIVQNKDSDKIKSIKYTGANSIGVSQNKLYFFDSDKKYINSLDFESYKMKTEYSAASPMQQFYCIGNGNLWIESQDANEFIYNEEKIFDISDPDAYIGTDYCIDEDRTGLFINDKHIQNLGYISDVCKIGDDLYYESDVEENKEIIFRISAKNYEKSTVLQFDMSEKNKYIKECPKGLYEYNDRLFIYVGINQEAGSSSDYERGEFWALDRNGNITGKYKLNEIPDSSTFTFYDNKLFFYDINDKLNSIDFSALIKAEIAKNKR